MTCVVNTADDVEYHGLHVSPDVDTVAYALAGMFDEERGFGVVGDTFQNAEALQRYGVGVVRGGRHRSRHLAPADGPAGRRRHPHRGHRRHGRRPRRRRAKCSR